MSWNSSIRNTTKDSLSCWPCFSNENSLIALHFTFPSRPTRMICSMLLIVIIVASVFLNTSSIYFIWPEMRRRTHINLLLSSQSLADLAINLVVMLPISILTLTDTSSRPNYHLCLAISFFDHWLHSFTMVTMAEIIADRYKVIVQRQLSATTQRTQKSMAVITVIWSTTFILSVCYVAPLLRQRSWHFEDTACVQRDDCPGATSLLQWVDEFVNRIAPFVVILFCYCRMLWLTYKSKHRVGVKNSIANWKTVLVGIYAKSVHTCLIIMTLFLIGTFPELAMSMNVNIHKSVSTNALLFATWMRFSMTALKPAIYMLQSGRRFPYCWFSNCCRNTSIAKPVISAKQPSISAMQSINTGASLKVSFTKAHDLFAINLQIEDADTTASSSQGYREPMIGKISRRNVEIPVRTASVIAK